MARRRSSSGRKHRSSGRKHRSSGRKKRSSGGSAKRQLARYVQAQQAMAAQTAAPPQAGAGGYINDAVPDSSTLLAYKLLKDSAGANSAVFDEMLQNELKYLLGGIAILKNDAKIANEMGGESMANAAKLAALLKNKTKELDWNDRIENTASNILYHDYNKPGKVGMAPGRINSSILAIDGNGEAQLDYRISGATNHGINVNRAGLPAVAARAFIAQNAAAAQLSSAAGALHPYRPNRMFV